MIMNRVHISRCTRYVQTACIAFIISLTLLPVEPRWGEADVWLAWAMPIICLLGAITMFINNDRIRVTRIDLLVTAWIVYTFARAYVGHEHPCSTQLLQMFSTALLYYSLRILLGNRDTVTHSFITFCMMACACVEATIGLQQMACGTSRHHLFALTGTFLNPGPYSAFLMTGSVAGLTVWQQSNNLFAGISERWKGIASICLKTACLLPLIVMPATWSRAAMVSTGICALWICRKQYWKYRYATWGAIAVALLTFYFVKRGSADGRVAIWAASLTSWMQSPWLGVGIGGFRQACAEGIAEIWHIHPSTSLFESAGVTEYAYNELIKVLVEQGTAGALICVSLTSMVMCRLYKQSLPLFAAMLSLMIFAMFSYPFETTPYRIIIVAAGAWSASSRSTADGSFNKGNAIHPFSASGICIIFTAMALSACSLIIAKEIGRRKDADKDMALFSSMRNAAFIKDYYELMPDAMDNPQFLFDFGMTLRDCGRYRDSNAVLRQGTLVSADPIFYVLMGNNYKDEKYYRLAEASYNKAYSIMPNRLYPLYKLMLLYDETGYKERCRAMASRVMREKSKIESPATEEMRRKAEILLNKYRKE